MSGSTTCSQSGRGCSGVLGKPLRGSPCRSNTVVIPTGSQCLPLLASVAYASAISSGVTENTPSVSEHTGSSGLSIPMRWATSTTFSRPASTESWTKTAFTELVVAADTGISPPLPSALFTT